MEDVENELTCSICLEYFEHPLMLPCSHNFCKKCIQGIVRAKHGVVSKSFDCPTCRFTINLDPVKGLDGLTFNRALENLARISKTESENADKLEKLISTWKSDTKLFSGLLNLECSDHGAHSSKFCKGCGKVLCNDCDVIKHSDKCRNPILPVTTLLELEGKLYDTLLRLNQNKKTITEKVALLQDILKQVDEYESKLLNQVDEECDWLINSIKSKKEELKKQLHESVQGVRQPVEKTLGQYQALLDKVANQTKWLNDITAPNKSLQTKLLHLESTEKQLSRLLGFEIIPLAHEPIPEISVPKITLDSQINKLETDVRHIDWQPQESEGGSGASTQTFYPSANMLTGSRNVNLSKEQGQFDSVTVNSQTNYTLPHLSSASNVSAASTGTSSSQTGVPISDSATVSFQYPPTSVLQKQDNPAYSRQRSVPVSPLESSASFKFPAQSRSQSSKPEINVPVSTNRSVPCRDPHSSKDEQGLPNFKTQFSFRNSFPSASSPEIHHDDTMPTLLTNDTSSLSRSNMSFSTSCPNIEKIKTIPKVGTNMLSRTAETSESSGNNFVSSTYAVPKQVTPDSSSIQQPKTPVSGVSTESKPALLQRAASHSATTTPSSPTVTSVNTFSSISFDVGKRRNSVTSVATLNTPDGRFVNAICSPRVGRRNSTFSIYVKRDGEVKDIVVSPTSDSKIEPLRTAVHPNPSLYTVQTIQPTVFTLNSDNNKKKAVTTTTSSGLTKQVSPSVLEKPCSSTSSTTQSDFPRHQFLIDKQISVDGATSSTTIDASYGGFCPSISFSPRGFSSCKHRPSHRARSIEHLDQIVSDRTTQINLLQLGMDKYKTHEGFMNPDSRDTAQDQKQFTSEPMEVCVSVTSNSASSFAPSSTSASSLSSPSSSSASILQSSQKSTPGRTQVFSLREYSPSSTFGFCPPTVINSSTNQPRMIHRSNSTESYLLRTGSRSNTPPPPPQSFTTISPVFVIGAGDSKNPSNRHDKVSGSRKPKFPSRSNSNSTDSIE